MLLKITITINNNMYFARPSVVLKSDNNSGKHIKIYKSELLGFTCCHVAIVIKSIYRPVKITKTMQITDI